MRAPASRYGSMEDSGARDLFAPETRFACPHYCGAEHQPVHDTLESQFLVPSQDFDEHSNGIPINDRAIEDWAKRYCVSRETVLRKLRDRGLVDQGYYEEKVGQWYKEQKTEEGGGNYYLTKGTYLGERYREDT